MDSNHYKKNICRICLENNVCLDWNTPLYQFYKTTYKDCYYKYSQLERCDMDPFPEMLCQNCSKALRRTHTLILKALKSHKLLQDRFSFNEHLVEEIETSTSDSQFDYINATPTEFETILIEKIEIEPVLDGHFECDETSGEEIIVSSNNSTEPDQQTNLSIVAREYGKTTAKNEIEETVKEPLSNTLEINSLPIKSVKNSKSEIITRMQASKKEKSSECKLMDGDDTKKETETPKIKPKRKRKCKEPNKPRMCSICSKILHNQYAVQMHEKTHSENRERKETCKVCGLKFYNKKILYSHMLIHKENREKKHKCEFCSKAFYDKGGLNVHRRIHLGQMVHCSLCSKQYFRQVDLNRHMDSHSASAINSEAKKRSRYLVRCQYCDKSILSTSFKSHTAAHLNEPLMKCTICDKEYFRRDSCVIHVKKVHQKSNDEYNDFIEIYKKNRMSHLFLEQKAEIQVNIE